MLEVVLNRSMLYLQHEKNLAYQSYTEFVHSEERLFAEPCSGFPCPISVLLDDDVIDIIAFLHRQYLCARADKVCRHAAQHYYGIKQDKVC